MSLLCDVLFEHWEAADLAADRAWLTVWRKIDARARGSGRSPRKAEISDAFLLRCEADELLQALRRALFEERARMHARGDPRREPRSGAKSAAPGT